MEITHDEAVEHARKWLLKPAVHRETCSLVITELVTSEPEQPDAIGWGAYGSVLVECKVSRSDFKADAYKVFRRNPDMGMGRVRYYLAPKGLIAVDDLPEKWGLVEVHNGKTRVKHWHTGAFKEYNYKAEMSLLVSLYRRLNVIPGNHISIRAYTIHTTNNPKASVTEAINMRNWIKQIRDPDRQIFELNGKTFLPLRNGRAVDLLKLHETSDLQACTPTSGHFPDETVQAALAGEYLYVAEPERNYLHVFETEGTGRQPVG